VLLHVQTTEPKILREYILQEGNKLEVKPPMAVTNAVSWRTEGIKYRKNEIFLDVIERCFIHQTLYNLGGDASI